MAGVRVTRSWGAAVLTVFLSSAGTGAAASAAIGPPGQTVTVIAHRGASGRAPENTIAAFKMAAAQRADMIELDVRRTRDRQLVVMHDLTLARTTDVEQVFPRRSPWKVADFTLAETRGLDAGSWFGRQYRGQPIPTLGQTLHAMRGSGLGLLLEIKSPERSPGIERQVAAELRRDPYWLAPDRRERRLSVQSFNWKSMRTFHRILPGVPIGLIGTPTTAQLPGLARFADQISLPEHNTNRAYVARAHALGVTVATWLINTPAALRRAVAAGVDGVITDDPGMVRHAQRPRQADGSGDPPPKRGSVYKPFWVGHSYC